MKSTHKNIKNKSTISGIRLGSKTDEGYVYNTKIDLGGDIASQISRVIKERKAKQELDTKIEQIRKVVNESKTKHHNLEYYHLLGKTMSFLKGSNFHNIKPFSVFRRITDEISNILPNIDNKRVTDHLMMMYRISKISKNDLKKATWSQWYEISKFKNVISDEAVLTKVLSSCGKSSGPDLREKIKAILSETFK